MTPPVELPAAVAPLRDRPDEAALFLDYDGTLAPIVADPAGALPVPGVPDLLGRLGRRLALVAVVSGRPVEYLACALGRPPRVRLAGVYGMEELGPDGVLHRDTAAEEWRDVVDGLTAALLADAPEGVEVEPKGLAVALHWRRAPEEEGWVREMTARTAERTGLLAQPGRMAIEMRPPVHADKGSVVARLGAHHGVVGCFGDDLGDLPAFAAVAELGRSGATVVRVAVADGESPPEVAAMADVVVEGPLAAVEMLEAIAAG